jgi:hypothetical protein
MTSARTRHVLLWRRPFTIAITVTAVLVSATGCASNDESAAQTIHRDDEMQRHCVDSGGTVQSRQPTFNTNGDPSAWIPMGEPVNVCRFQTGEDDPASRIYVDMVTLSSTKPTLAALAYLSKTPLPNTADESNPATALCTALGGTSSYGSTVNGGGLVNTDDPDDTIITPCVFADQSFIEEWGIAYYSDGIIRGTDLAPLFRFSASDAPSIFATAN